MSPYRLTRISVPICNITITLPSQLPDFNPYVAGGRLSTSGWHHLDRSLYLSASNHDPHLSVTLTCLLLRAVRIRVAVHTTVGVVWEERVLGNPPFVLYSPLKTALFPNFHYRVFGVLPRLVWG